MSKLTSTEIMIRSDCIKLAKLSDCMSTRYGCIIYDETDDKLVSTGYNKSANRDFCCMRKHMSSGVGYDSCMALHAEQMAIGKIPEANYSIKDLKEHYISLYLIALHRNDTIRNNLLLYPCITCAKIISFADIINGVVFFLDNSIRYLTREETLKEAIKFMTIAQDESYKEDISNERH